MTGIFGFLGTLFSFALLLFQEYLKRSSEAAAAKKQYAVDQAEFDSLCSSVLTRIRLRAATESSQAKTVENQVDESLSERSKEP